MIDLVLADNRQDVSEMQLNCLKRIYFLFEKDIWNLIVDNYYFTGVRGKYDVKENYCLHFKFCYYEYDFEFYLCYDQLEFYITKEKKILKECNLEDFWKDTIMIEKFINYLKNSMMKLNIPYQNKAKN